MRDKIDPSPTNQTQRTEPKGKRDPVENVGHKEVRFNFTSRSPNQTKRKTGIYHIAILTRSVLFALLFNLCV